MLQRLLAEHPDCVKARRLLYELELRRDRDAAPAQRKAIEEAYGHLGLFEMVAHEMYLGGEQRARLPYVEEQSGVPYRQSYRALRTALQKLERRGDYAPSEALPVIERMLRRYPDLAVIRLS